MRPGVNHGFDSEHHAYAQRYPPVTKSMVRDMGILVHVAPNAVASIVAHDAEACALSDTLDGITNIPQVISRTCGIKPSPHAFLSHTKELFLLLVNFADGKSPGVITNPSIDYSASIDRKNVPIAKYRLRRRDTMDNLIID